MFWNRKKKIVNGSLGPFLMPGIPAKKEFETMLETLRDAEKYDSVNEIEIRNSLLNSLSEQIQNFKNK